MNVCAQDVLVRFRIKSDILVCGMTSLTLLWCAIQATISKVSFLSKGNIVLCYDDQSDWPSPRCDWMKGGSVFLFDQRNGNVNEECQNWSLEYGLEDWNVLLSTTLNFFLLEGLLSQDLIQVNH